MTTIVFSTFTSDGEETNRREIAQVSIQTCPHAILVADHYRDNGTCKCDDKDEQAMMIKKWGYSKKDFN